MEDNVPEFKWRQEERPETGLPQDEGTDDASRTDGGSGRNSVGGKEATENMYEQLLKGPIFFN